MSTRKTKPAAAPVKTTDSFQNFSARVGLGAGSQMDAGRYGASPITRDRVQLEFAYRDNWVAGQVIDTVADDMTRAGIELHTALPPDQTEKLMKAFDRLQLWTKLRDTIAWSRLYGGAIAVFLIDGQKLDTPLDISKVALKQFKGLTVLDRWQLDPTFSVNDTVSDLGPDMGMPKFYKVQMNADALSGAKIHYSRVIRMDGVKMPYQQRITENGWGISVLERLWDRLVAFDSTTMGTCQLVFKAHLRTYKVDGLRDIIGNGGKAMDGLVEQMKMIRTYQSSEGLTLMDSKDTFEAHSYTFAGLDNVLLQIGQQLSGATQIPLVRLFGQSPAGLNSSGDSDLRTYYDGISQRQNASLRDGMSRLIALLSRSVLGTDWPDDADFDFRSLWQLDDTEKATIAKTIAEAVSAAESSGLISQQTALKELRQSSRTTGIFTNITDEDINAAETEPPDPADLIADAPLPGAIATTDSEHWITVENGEHLLIGGDGTVIGGAGGNMNGTKLNPSSKSAPRPGSAPRTKAHVESDLNDLSKVAQGRMAEAHANKGTGVAISGSEIEHLDPHEKSLHHELRMELQTHENGDRQAAAQRIAAKIAARAERAAQPLDHGELNIPGRTNNINAELDRYKTTQAATAKVEHKANMATMRERNATIKSITANKAAMTKYAANHNTTPKQIADLINEMPISRQDMFIKAYVKEYGEAK